MVWDLFEKFWEFSVKFLGCFFYFGVGGIIWFGVGEGSGF